MRIIMPSITVVACVLTATLWSLAARADIYVWVDADGIRHISNVNPPTGADVFLVTGDPTPTDAPGSAPPSPEPDARPAEIRERADRLKKRQAALERRLADVEEKVDAARSALERAQQRLSEAQASAARETRYAGTVVYHAGYLRPRHHRFPYHRWKSHRRGSSPSLAGRPFRLGAVHIPLINAHDPIRRAKPRRVGDSKRYGHRGSPHPRFHRHHNDGRRR